MGRIDKSYSTCARCSVMHPKVSEYSDLIFDRGPGIHPVYNMTNAKAVKLLNKEIDFEKTAEQFAEGSRILNAHVELSEDRALNVTALSKKFHLSLPDGPYRFDFTRNGRYMAIAGQKGQVSAFDWQKKMLRFDTDVQDTVYDCKWLHNESMLAVAQSKFIYIYDHAGVEIHRMHKHSDSRHLEFLPYHFLLASGSVGGILRYFDISTGSLAAEIHTKSGNEKSASLNSQTGVLSLGHSNGTVTFWSPVVQEPLVKMFCHKGPVHATAVSSSGNFFATSGTDGQIKIWDLRNYNRALVGHSFNGASSLAFSQTDFLGVSIGRKVLVWNDVLTDGAFKTPSINEDAESRTSCLKFCPYEDLVACGTAGGIKTFISPGCAESNYDSYEANPYATAKQRQEMEVKALLNKLPLESIVMTHHLVASVSPKKDKSGSKKLTTARRRHIKNRSNVIDHPHGLSIQERRTKQGPLSRFIRN